MQLQKLTTSDVAASVELTKAKIRLEWYEQQINARARSLAAIFLELRNDSMQPWRASGYDSYEIYCREVWGMTPRRMQQIAAGETVKALLSAEAPDLAPVVATMPEGQVRELAAAPVEKRAEVLRAAVEVPGKMTARKIKAAKARVVDPAVPAAPGPAAPAVDTCPAVAGTNVPVDVPLLSVLNDDHCLELSALVSNRVGDMTGRAVTESEDCHLALTIGGWLRSLGL